LADILSFKEKRQKDEENKKAHLNKLKRITIQRAVQFGRITGKCDKCGVQIDLDSLTGNRELRVPYYFCRFCSDEYIDYIERLKGGGDKDCYWRNMNWLEKWRKWIDYQSAVDGYMRSREFKMLIKEMKDGGQDDE
jgi:hypothetical protein